MRHWSRCDEGELVVAWGFFPQNPIRPALARYKLRRVSDASPGVPVVQRKNLHLARNHAAHGDTANGVSGDWLHGDSAHGIWIARHVAAHYRLRDEAAAFWCGAVKRCA